VSLVAADGGFADGERPCLLRLLGPYSSLSPSASLSHAAELMEACACTVSSIFCRERFSLLAEYRLIASDLNSTAMSGSARATTQAVAFHLITQIHALGVLW